MECQDFLQHLLYQVTNEGMPEAKGGVDEGMTEPEDGGATAAKKTKAATPTPVEGKAKGQPAADTPPSAHPYTPKATRIGRGGSTGRTCAR